MGSRFERLVEVLRRAEHEDIGLNRSRRFVLIRADSC
jgi:hypothetical protein